MQCCDRRDSLQKEQSVWTCVRTCSMSLLGTKKNARGFTQDYTSHATMNTVAVLVNNMEGRLDSLHAPLDHTILLYHGSYYLLLLPLLLIVYTIYIFIYIIYIPGIYIFPPSDAALILRSDKVSYVHAPLSLLEGAPPYVHIYYSSIEVYCCIRVSSICFRQ